MINAFIEYVKTNKFKHSSTNDSIVLNAYGFNETFASLKNKLSNYQQILPMILTYTAEFDKEKTNMSNIPVTLWKKLADAFELNSDTLISDIDRYFTDCRVNGPTVDFFDEVKYSGLYWGDNFNLISDSLNKVLNKLDLMSKSELVNLQTKRDSVIRYQSGVDDKVIVNLLNYLPYRTLVNYTKPSTPDWIVDSLSILNIDLPPSVVDSIYNSFKKEKYRLKQIENSSTFTIFRNGSTLETEQPIGSQEKLLLQQYITDSISSLKKNSPTPEYYDRIYNALNTPSILISRLKDSIKSIYSEMCDDYLVLKSMDAGWRLQTKWQRMKKLIDLDSIKEYSSSIKLDYYNILSRYANNYLPLEEVSTNINTNIPRINAQDICSIPIEYDQSKGFTPLWNSNSNNLILESIRYILFVNRTFDTDYNGNYFHQSDLVYDIESNQWIVEGSNTDEAFWWMKYKSCLYRYFIGFKLVDGLVQFNSLYFNLNRKY
jgi:hypothetical protein